MNKFKPGKSMNSFTIETLSREQMYQVNGGRQAATGSTKSICHIDGKDDSDVPVIVWHPVVA